MITFSSFILVLIVAFVLQTVFVVIIILHNVKNMNKKMMNMVLEQSLNTQAMLSAQHVQTAQALTKVYVDVDKAITYSTDIFNTRMRRNNHENRRMLENLAVKVDTIHDVVIPMNDYVSKQVDSILTNQNNMPYQSIVSGGIYFDIATSDVDKFKLLMRSFSPLTVKKAIHEYLTENAHTHDMVIREGAHVFDIIRGEGIIVEFSLSDFTLMIEFDEYPEYVFEYSFNGYLTDVDVVSTLCDSNV